MLSSTTSFTLDVYKSIESAIKLSKGNPSNKEDISNALICSNLVLQEWSIAGVNLWKVEQIDIPLSTSTTFTLPSDVLDVLTFSIRITSAGENRDRAIERKSTIDYSQITNKHSKGIPVLYVPQRKIDSNVISLWPIPDSDTAYTGTAFVVKKFYDVTGYGENIDIPARFLPAFTTRLGYYLGLMNSDGTPEWNSKLDRLDVLSKELFTKASEDDADKVPLKIVPG